MNELVGRELVTEIGGNPSYILRLKQKSSKIEVKGFKRVDFTLCLVTFSKGVFSTAEKTGFIQIDDFVHLLKDNHGILCTRPNAEKVIGSFTKLVKKEADYVRAKVALNIGLALDGKFVKTARMDGILILD